MINFNSQALFLLSISLTSLNKYYTEYTGTGPNPKSKFQTVKSYLDYRKNLPKILCIGCWHSYGRKKHEHDDEYTLSNVPTISATIFSPRLQGIEWYSDYGADINKKENLNQIPEGIFDIIYLEDVDEPIKPDAYQNLNRVLKSGGYVFGTGKSEFIDTLKTKVTEGREVRILGGILIDKKTKKYLADLDFLITKSKVNLPATGEEKETIILKKQ